MELKSEAVVQSCSLKKVFLKISKNYQKNICVGVKSLIKAISCEFCGIFRDICFVEHLRTHTCVK